MITVTVTSHSSLSELHVAERTLADLIKLAVGKDMEKPTLKEIAENLKVPVTTFNAAELAEAEALGKPVCSTVDAVASQTALADMTDNISTPAPTTVFGQPAQTVASEVKTAAPATDNPVRDVDGLVWDARIHSSSKELNKDGTWRKRRGVDAELVATVEAELRGLRPFSVDAPKIGVSAPEMALSVPLPPQTPSAIPEFEEKPVVHQQTQTPSATDMTFPELLDGVTKAMVAGQLNQDQINGALQAIGLTALPHLMGNAHLIPQFREKLGGVI